MILLPLAAASLGLRQPDSYRATARVLLTVSASGEDAPARIEPSTDLERRDLANEINVASSDAVGEIIRQRLDLSSGDDLRPASVSAHAEADVLEFTATGSTANEAAFFANTWASAYVELRDREAEQATAQALAQLQARLEALRAQRGEIRAGLSDLEGRLASAGDELQRASLQGEANQEASRIADDLAFVDTQIGSAVDGITQLELEAELRAAGNARIVQNAVAPSTPASSPLARNAAIGLIGGWILGIVLALLVDRFDRSIRTGDDVQHLGLNVLGAIPAAPGALARKRLATITHSQPRSPMADAYQRVRSAVQFAMLGQNMSAIVVTSPKRGDGKTTTAVNLGLALSSVERKVVLADTDFRRPQLHTLFDTPATPGISDAVLDRIPLAKIAAKHPQLPSTIAALPAGTEPPDPVSFLASPPFELLLADLDSQCDLAIIDTPPVLAADDALALSPHAGGIVLVVRAGRTKRKDVLRAVERLNESGGQLLGVVVNGVKARSIKLAPSRIESQPECEAAPDPDPGADGADGANRPSMEHAAATLTVQHPAITPRREPKRLAPSRS